MADKTLCPACEEALVLVVPRTGYEIHDILAVWESNDPLTGYKRVYIQTSEGDYENEPGDAQTAFYECRNGCLEQVIPFSYSFEEPTEIFAGTWTKQTNAVDESFED